METPIYKSDLIVSSKDVCRKGQSLTEYLITIVKRDLSDVKADFNEAEIECLVKENCVIKFTACNVPFTIKVV